MTFYWWFDHAEGRWHVGGSVGFYAPDHYYDADVWRSWIEDRAAPAERRPLDAQVQYFMDAYDEIHRQVADNAQRAMAGLETRLLERRFGFRREVLDFVAEFVNRGAIVLNRSGPQPLHFGASSIEVVFQRRFRVRIVTERDEVVDAAPMAFASFKDHHWFGAPVIAWWLFGKRSTVGGPLQELEFFKANLDQILSRLDSGEAVEAAWKTLCELGG